MRYKYQLHLIHIHYRYSIALTPAFLPPDNRDIGEVIHRANATRYGLAAGVFTKNLNTANTLTRGLKVGTVWINCFFVFDAAIPFGGFKMSGQGRERGLHGLKSYLQVKAVVTPLENPADRKSVV